MANPGAPWIDIDRTVLAPEQLYRLFQIISQASSFFIVGGLCSS